MVENDFTKLYTEYSPRIYRVCLGYINEAEQAKDMVQETFINVWKGLASFRGEAKMSTWIFRIATNTCLRHLEKSKRMVMTELPFQLAEETTNSKEPAHQFLYKCISELDESDRIIISLELEDIPQAEIAEIVGISVGNVRVKIHRIKEKLQNKFKANEQFH